MPLVTRMELRGKAQLVPGKDRHTILEMLCCSIDQTSSGHQDFSMKFSLLQKKSEKFMYTSTPILLSDRRTQNWVGDISPEHVIGLTV